MITEITDVLLDELAQEINVFRRERLRTPRLGIERARAVGPLAPEALRNVVEIASTAIDLDDPIERRMLVMEISLGAHGRAWTDEPPEYISASGNRPVASAIAQRKIRQRDVRKQVIRAMRLFAAEHGHAPAEREWTAHNMSPGQAHVRRLFGRWNEAVEAAGLTPSRPTPRRTQRTQA